MHLCPHQAALWGWLFGTLKFLGHPYIGVKFVDVEQ